MDIVKTSAKKKIRVLFCTLMALFPASLSHARSLDFLIDNQVYLKNLEYNNVTTRVTGETFAGDVLKPRFRFNIQDNLNMEFGTIVKLNFADDSKDSKGFPLIALNYDFAPGSRFTAGTLDRAHPLLDAFFDDVLEFVDPHEQGLQFRTKRRNFNFDLWLDWEQKETEVFAEKLNIGNYTQWQSGGAMLDFQALWSHAGGQKNSAGGIVNNLTMALGTGYTFTPETLRRPDRGLQKVGFSVHVLGAFDKPNPGSNFTDNRDSSGLLGQIFTTVDGTDLHALVWSGFDHLGIHSRKGDPLYSSEHFVEVGIGKTWALAKNVSLEANISFVRLRDELNHIDRIAVKWSGDFPLFPEYFERLTRADEEKNRKANMKKRPKKKSKTRSPAKRSRR